MKTPTKTSPKPPSRHGLRGLMARVSHRGLAAIDRRSAGYRALVGWRRELETDLGGADHLSAQQRALIESVCRMRLYLDHLDAWLMSQATLIRKRTLLPIFRERMDLAGRLERTLGVLGLQRQEPPAPSIAEFVERVKPHPVDELEREPE